MKNSENRSKIIGIIGGGYCPPEVAELAEAVGYEIAKRGAILLCGGKGGVMEAGCRGAKKGGGQTIGILPDDTPDTANPYVDIPITTGIGIARNIIIVRSSDALIAIDGKFGTLSEIAFALQLNVPVVSLQSWDGIDSSIFIANSVEDAVDKAFHL